MRAHHNHSGCILCTKACACLVVRLEVYAMCETENDAQCKPNVLCGSKTALKKEMSEELGSKLAISHRAPNFSDTKFGWERRAQDARLQQALHTSANTTVRGKRTKEKVLTV